MSQPMDVPWRDDPELQKLIESIGNAGGTARLVGGFVRDWLAGRSTGDIDIATDLLPDRVSEVLEAVQFRVLPTGIAHGTVTALMNRRSFEVTTLRRDLETDGRHATVGFTNDWTADAQRRDFTINALYADLDGVVHDPTGQGRDDLKAKRLRFVGDPDERIREDYLRIIRFYRFAAVTGFDQDEAGLAACGRNVTGLDTLSAERIWQEMKKLISAEFRIPVLERMMDRGILSALMPEARLPSWLGKLPDGDPLLPLAAMTGPRAANLARRWKLSGAETDRIVDASPSDGVSNLPAADLRRLAWRCGVQAAGDRLLIDAAREGVDASRKHAKLQDWIPPDFQLSGRDVLLEGVPAGPQIGSLLSSVEDWWLDKDFAPGREDCLAELRRLIDRS